MKSEWYALNAAIDLAMDSSTMGDSCETTFESWFPKKAPQFRTMGLHD
jgi:hypothetical protein